jgi:SAM-dependent methyltransferase
MTVPLRYDPVGTGDEFYAVFGQDRVRVTRSRERGYGGLDGSGEPHRECYEALVRILRAPRPLDVLDAGCGSGYGADLLSTAGGHRVTGFDLSSEAVSFASRRAPSAHFARGTCAALPFRDGSFDLVVNIDNIEHVEDDASAVREMRRVLRAGGLYAVTTPCTWPGKDVSRYHMREYSREDFEALLVRSGMEPVQFLLETPFYFVLARRDDGWGEGFARASAARGGDPITVARAVAGAPAGSMPKTARREALLLGAEALLAGGDAAGALELASRADRLDPTSARTMVALARVATALGDHALALEALEQAVLRAPDSYLAWTAVAESCERLGDRDGAMRAIRTAKGLAPADPHIASAVARLAQVAP